MQNITNFNHRSSIRLFGYDYSKEGLYFITICCKDRKCLLGEITKGKMVLNNMGEIASDFWLKIPEHFPQVILHDYIVMPNHIHGIIQIIKKQNDVPHFRTQHDLPEETNDVVWTRHGVSLHDNIDDPVGTCHGMSSPVTSSPVTSSQGMPPDSPSQFHSTKTLQANKNQFGKAVAGSVPVIINQYKSSVKRWCNKNGYSFFQWQSRFHDHIIRNDQSYQRISDYIQNNPVSWLDDKFYQE